MSLPEIASREEWLAARKELLTREKELTRLNDALNADRRRMPMVAIAKEYTFTGPDGVVGLADLFDGRRQLIIQHFMFDPAWDDGCSSCTASVDELSAGLLEHLHARETTFVARLAGAVRKARRIPDAQRLGRAVVLVVRRRFQLRLPRHARRVGRAARGQLPHRGRARAGWGPAWVTRAAQPIELPAVSCFLRDGDGIFHTNSTYARGTEYLAGAYTFLDLTALGRQEDWEEPKGRAVAARGAVPDFSV